MDVLQDPHYKPDCKHVIQVSYEVPEYSLKCTIKNIKPKPQSKIKEEVISQNLEPLEPLKTDIQFSETTDQFPIDPPEEPSFYDDLNLFDL